MLDISSFLSPRRFCRSVPSLLAALLLLEGCVHGANGRASSGQPVHSEAAQSAAEFDLALDLWLRRDQPRLALEHALRAIELDEDNAQAHHLVALLYLDFCRRDPADCRLQDAESAVRRALEEDEHFRDARNTLGVVLVHQGRYVEAIEVLRPLTQDILYRTPENAWGNLGWAYLRNGQLPQAIDALQRSTAIQPKFCVGHYRLGVAFEQSGQLEPAHQALTRALSVDDPRCAKLQVAYQLRGHVAAQLGRQDEARSDLAECVHLDKQTTAGRECNARLNAIQ